MQIWLTVFERLIVYIYIYIYITDFKMLCTAQKRSVRALFATSQQPHSRDILLNQKILPLNKLINQQEGINTCL